MFSLGEHALILVKFDLIFNSQNYSRDLPEKYKYIFFILNALSFITNLLIADQICSGNLFEAPSSLERGILRRE